MSTVIEEAESTNRVGITLSFVIAYLIQMLWMFTYATNRQISAQSVVFFFGLPTLYLASLIIRGVVKYLTHSLFGYTGKIKLTGYSVYVFDTRFVPNFISLIGSGAFSATIAIIGFNFWQSSNIHLAVIGQYLCYTNVALTLINVVPIVGTDMAQILYPYLQQQPNDKIAVKTFYEGSGAVSIVLILFFMVMLFANGTFSYWSLYIAAFGTLIGIQVLAATGTFGSEVSTNNKNSIFSRLLPIISVIATFVAIYYGYYIIRETGLTNIRVTQAEVIGLDAYDRPILELEWIAPPSLHQVSDFTVTTRNETNEPEWLIGNIAGGHLYYPFNGVNIPYYSGGMYLTIQDLTRHKTVQVTLPEFGTLEPIRLQDVLNGGPIGTSSLTIADPVTVSKGQTTVTVLYRWELIYTTRNTSQTPYFNVQFFHGESAAGEPIATDGNSLEFTTDLIDACTLTKIVVQQYYLIDSEQWIPILVRQGERNDCLN